MLDGNLAGPPRAVMGMDPLPGYGMQVSAETLRKAQELAALFGVDVTELLGTLVRDLHAHEQAAGRLPVQGTVIPWPRPQGNGSM